MVAKVLKDVIEQAETWPPQDQEELAEYAREIQARRTGVYIMSDEERAAVRRGLAQADRGATNLGRCQIRDQRVARRTADALADAVHEPRGKNEAHRSRKRDPSDLLTRLYRRTVCQNGFRRRTEWRYRGDVRMGGER